MIGYRQIPNTAVRSSSNAAASAVNESPAAAPRRHKPDYWILLLSIFLLVIGQIVVYAIGPALSAVTGRSTSNYVFHQVLAVGLSIVAFTFTAQLPLNRWRELQKPLLLAALIATALAIVLPVNPEYPAHRWVRLGGLSFQSVELLKFAVVIGLALFLARQVQAGQITSASKTFKPLLIMLGVGGFAVAGIQSDLGSAGVLVVMAGVMSYVAGLPMKKIILIAGIIAIGLVLAIAAEPYRRDRFFSYLHPEADCQNAGYQACQALIAVGSGGIAGLGLGRSVQAYGYLPEAANDSIFAIYAEKFGFIGGIVLLMIFAALFARISKVAERAPDVTTRLMAVGVLTWLAVQAIINIGAMIGLLPLKGITLPFISYGGTSVVFMAAAMGLVFQISRYTSFLSPLEGRKGQAYDHSRNRRRIGRTHYADLSGRR